jgi:PAS domain S-box-containing protein
MGTTVSVTKMRACAAAAAADPAAAPHGPGVLLVDDQPARLLAYESVLSGLEVQCVRAHSGEEALRKLLEREFAVIVLDVNMPGMDGFEVARAIREHPRLERTPIIFVTGVHVSELDRLKGYEAGAIDYIAVPVVPEILRSKIAVLTELYRRRSELLALNRELAAARRGITDRLRENERLYRAIVDQAPVAVAYNRMDDRFEYVNEAFCKLVGYTRDELCEMKWQDITHPQDIERDLALTSRVLAGEMPHYELEKRYVRKDGATVWVRLFGNLVRDDTGGPLWGVAVAMDVTERQRADLALRESRQRLLLASRAARLGTHDWQIQAGTIAWDERTAELWGVAPSESVAYEVFIAGIHPADRAKAEEAVSRALDPHGDGQYFATFRVISRRDGRPRWVEAHGQAFFEGGQARRLVGTVQDVTDRTLAADRLRESEGRFRELANHIDQFAWTCDELGRVNWYNQRWYEYTGTTYEEMQGFGWTKVHHPEHLPRVISGVRQCAEAGKPWEDTFPLRGKDGTYRWFLTRAVPIRGEDGRILRWFGTNTDVTEQRRLQEALEAADRRKDEFLAMLAHELRNPVAPIACAAEVLAGRVSSDAKASSCVDVIRRQASHLSRLLDDLLDVARITQRRVVLQREVVSLVRCVEQAIETAEPLMREKGHHLTVESAPLPLLVEADPVRVAQSVANVLINAAKYTAPGGRIGVRVFLDGAFATVEVRDDGIGIAPQLLPRIFDLFVQSEQPLDRTEGGLGIGLAVCRELVRMHGGTVSAASPGPGRGTTITIRLPLADRAADGAGGGESAGAPRRRILIVDDNRDAADVLALLLESDGHEVLAVYSAEDALEQVRAFKPDVVLVDIGLPGMDGCEVARRMSASAPAARLIALSGYGGLEDKLRSSAAGFEGHLVKPVAAAALREVLRAGDPGGFAGRDISDKI